MAQVFSTKHLLIDKANTMIVAVMAVAAFVIVSSLVASKTLLSQAGYQGRVIAAKKQALTQLKQDITASSTLVKSYQAFANTPQNIIGGNPKGSGDRDGDNAKIILDALPSKYDFPALATSLDKLLTDQGLTIDTISGTDKQLTEQNDQASASPVPIAMPFQVSVNGNYQAVENLVGTFEKSIRPFQFQTLLLAGGQNDLTLNVTAQTFYQPGKTLTITTEVIK